MTSPSFDHIMQNERRRGSLKGASAANLLPQLSNNIGDSPQK